MNVLILGGAARLGPYVVRALENEHTLRVTDILPIETPHEFQRVDIASPDDVLRAAEGMDAIVNCSVVRPDRQVAFDVNTRGCYNMMRAAIAHGIPRVINTGPHFTIEGETYTTFDYEISPDVPPHPSTNLYALSKGLGQEICKGSLPRTTPFTCSAFFSLTFATTTRRNRAETIRSLSPGAMPPRLFAWV